MNRRFDAVVIGASVGGLATAALLAKAGKRVALIERQAAIPEPVGALFALDPEMIATLGLAGRGLRLVERDLPLLGWDEDGPPLMLARHHRTAGFFTSADAEAWDLFLTALAARARVLRRWWWFAHRDGRAADMLSRRAERAAFLRECLAGGEDFLNLHLELPRLRALLLFDAVAGGLAPSEPGSALALTWRAAQEMAGLQGATAIAQPGTLIAALSAAARMAGVEIFLGEAVTAISVAHDAASGVILESGQEIAAGAVLSSLSRQVTERLAGLETFSPAGGVGEAELVFTLDKRVAVPKARIILAPPQESYADAHEAARAGKLAAALPLECIATAPGRLVVTARLVPTAPLVGWDALRAPLSAAVAKSLARHLPGFVGALKGVTIKPPQPLPRATLSRLLAPAIARAATRFDALYLCGADAEPLPCVSGRAGRFAAKFAADAFKAAS